jgi:16S rRNA (guanine1207-N2)-methyltransferase
MDKESWCYEHFGRAKKRFLKKSLILAGTDHGDFDMCDIERWDKLMKQKSKADDDFRDLPTLTTKIKSLNQKAILFSDAQSNRVITKLDKEYPQVALNVEAINLEEGEKVLSFQAQNGLVALGLAATYSQSNFYLYENNLSYHELLQKNLNSNCHLVSDHIQLLNEQALDELLAQKAFTSVIFEVLSHQGQLTTQAELTRIISALPSGGKLFLASHKNTGFAKQFDFLSAIVGERNLKIIARGGGGHRLAQASVTSEQELAPVDLNEQIEFCVCGRDFQAQTQPALFSHQGLDEGTRLLLEKVLPVKQDEFTNLLDLGCGWGAIGLVALSLNEKAQATLVDVDTRAVKLSQQNLDDWGLATRAQAIATADVKKLTGKYDLILSNPPFHTDTKTLERLLRDSATKLTKGGEIHLVVEKSFTPKFEAILEKTFGRCRLTEGTTYQLLAARK